MTHPAKIAVEMCESAEARDRESQRQQEAFDRDAALRRKHDAKIQADIATMERNSRRKG